MQTKKSAIIALLTVCMVALFLQPTTLAFWKDEASIGVTGLGTGSLTAEAIIDPTRVTDAHFSSKTQPYVLKPMFPSPVGTPTGARDIPVNVTGLGEGQTLRWQFKIDVNVASQFTEHIWARVLVSDCSNAQAMTVYTPGAVIRCDGNTSQGFVPGQTVQATVRLVLKESAPLSLQGQAFNPEILATVQQYTGGGQ